MAGPVVEAAAAVILRPDGRFLLARRPPGKPYGGYWEFPGGKIEPGETAAQALVRELREELGIESVGVTPWITREFAYPHAHVRLHFFRVTQWHGEIQDLHHTALEWRGAGEVDLAPLLPANLPVLRALALPDFYAITCAATIGVDAQLARLEVALAAGLRLLQVRESQMAVEARAQFATSALRLARARGAGLLISGDPALAEALGADGVHLPAARLREINARPDFRLVAASCHDAEELARAALLELDFVVLGPVRPTATHPGAPGMGWSRFARLLEGYPLPVFALGGLSRADIPAAHEAGAHGVAAIGAAWAA